MPHRSPSTSAPSRLQQALQLGTGLMALGASVAPTEARTLQDAQASQPADGLTTHRPLHHRHTLHNATAHTPHALPHVSLVLPNFARPRNVEHIVETVANYALVDETLVWDVHIDPKNKPFIEAPKTSVIHTPETHTREKWGLMTRFKDCVLASNEWVLITDDDQLLGEAAIAKMIETKLQDPDRLVCYFGRDIGEGHTYQDMHYRVWDPPAPQQVPICLTKAMLTDRRFCLEAIRQAPLLEDLARQGDPYWNGEDIWHALTAFHLTGKLGVLLPREDASYTILPAPDGIGDARPGAFDHRAHREKMVQVGAERLGLNVSAMHLQPWTANA